MRRRGNSTGPLPSPRGIAMITLASAWLLHCLSIGSPSTWGRASTAVYAWVNTQQRHRPLRNNGIPPTRSGKRQQTDFREAPLCGRQKQQQQQQQRRRRRALFSLATPPAESSRVAKGDGEGGGGGPQSGRILEGGKVIDFSSVKASSKAEKALADAKKTVISMGRAKLNDVGGGDNNDVGILGINQDVIDEVGHELATFASPQDVQDCAGFLRSKAPGGLFRVRENGGRDDRRTSYSAAEEAKFRALLRRGYDESGEVTGAFAKTFYLGTMLLGEEAREAIWAVYVWCRRTDEIVDAPRETDGDGEMLRDLSSWEMRLENLWEYGDVVDAYDLCLLDVRIKYPNLDITPFMDMIRGMLMDVPGLGQERYDTFDELHLYCYRVAGTVGLMSLPIFGCAKGYDDQVAREPALSLGVAFQLTNILRDVGEDAAQRGRIYLPREDLRRFGVTERQIFDRRVDGNYVNMMKYQIDRARMYYGRARRGVFMLAPESRLPVQSSLDAYGKILDKIEENGYDSLTRRAYVGKWEKLSIIPFSWYRTLEVSQTLPLPGDKPVDMNKV